MGTFKTKATLYGSPDLIPNIADRICTAFAADGYEVKREKLMSGGADITVTKGGLFKAALGMKTALKITLIQHGNDSIAFDAGVGIFGQQVCPRLSCGFSHGRCSSLRFGGWSSGPNLNTWPSP